mmetsp:Transcript_137712/g.326247  ORF Transcript_137712/g.326247 Transcript_137712/m.326247 type:complete len:229 (-) Transcript_137712:264-950(-)
MNCKKGSAVSTCSGCVGGNCNNSMALLVGFSKSQLLLSCSQQSQVTESSRRAAAKICWISLASSELFFIWASRSMAAASRFRMRKSACRSMQEINKLEISSFATISASSLLPAPRASCDQSMATDTGIRTTRTQTEKTGSAAMKLIIMDATVLVGSSCLGVSARVSTEATFTMIVNFRDSMASIRAVGLQEQLSASNEISTNQICKSCHGGFSDSSAPPRRRQRTSTA